MLKEIAGISIEGKCFNAKTDFKLFSNQNKRLSLIYGKNGSGKSTISYAFKCIPNIVPDPFTQLNLISHATTTSFYNELLTNKIFVFNEEYIEQNVKFEKEGLNTVILFGEQSDIQKEIDKINGYYEKNLQYQENKLNPEVEIYCQEKSFLSPEYCKKDLSEKLKSWRNREDSFSSRRSNITQPILTSIINYKSNRNKDEVEELFYNKIKEYELCKKLPPVFNKEIQKIQFNQESENNLIKILAKKIEQKNFSELAQKIHKAILAGFQKRIESAKETFSRENVAICPFCFQKISKEYKENLINNIEQVLNQDVENHKEELINSNLNLTFSNYAEFKPYYEELINNIEKKINQCILIKDEYNKLIIDKQNNIYTPIIQENKKLYIHIQELNSLLQELENKRKKVYEQTSKEKNLIEELSIINIELAALEFKNEIDNYKTVLMKKEALNKKLELCKQTQKNYKDKIDILNAQKADVSIGEKQINAALRYIFFYENRLKITSRDKKYYLEVNGDKVTPNDISIGERNILALAYFFTEIFNGQNYNKIYQDDILIILDDPISSFDVENRIGIISYLRQQIDLIISGNNQSKIIMLSHDIMTFFDFMKTFKELSDTHGGKGKSGEKNSLYDCYELKEKKLTIVADSKNEYKLLIETIYSFATSNYQTCDQSIKIAIGNIMRRALEAFSTFMYNCSIEEITRKDFIKKRLNNYSEYFGNLMYRLVLNQESHSKDLIYKIGNDPHFSGPNTDMQKHHTAKDILLFLYLIDKDHILTCLKDKNSNNDVENTLEEWKKQLSIMK